MGDSNREALMSRNKFTRSKSHAQDELKSFRSYIKWMCVDQSSYLAQFMSYSMFVLFTMIVPAASHFVLACDSCDGTHKRPYDGVVQLSLSTLATLAFICLATFVRRFGLRRFLFFDKLCDESETVRRGYTAQLNRSLKILSIFVLPCFLVESAYKIWWYASGGSQIPFLGNVYLSDTIACMMELCSWLYRTTIIFLVCVLFRLICHLQILRLEDYGEFFQTESDVASVLSEHLRIRRHLRIISHRYRNFILWALVIITGSQFASLLITTKPHAVLNFYIAGELALCSVTLVASILIILRSATKITHKAQAITCLASKWHVCATVDSLYGNDGETPRAPPVTGRGFSSEGIPGLSDTDDEDGLDGAELIPSYAYNTISFQKRQALVTYFENNKAGITVYGFTLDRGTLHLIFCFELSLVLWLLGKTIGLS